MHIGIIIAIAAGCGFLIIGVVTLINYLIDKSKIVYKSKELIIRYDKLNKDQIKDVKQWVKELHSPVRMVFIQLTCSLPKRLKWEKVELIKVTIQPEVFIRGREVNGLCSPCGKFCEIRYGEYSFMFDLLLHEVGHGVIVQNGLQMTEKQQHDILAERGL